MQATPRLEIPESIRFSGGTNINTADRERATLAARRVIASSQQYDQDTVILARQYLRERGLTA